MDGYSLALTLASLPIVDSNGTLRGMHDTCFKPLNRNV
jgi:hypothetical protein